MGDADKLLSDLNERQREAVTSLTSPLAILAGAGSWPIDSQGWA